MIAVEGSFTPYPYTPVERQSHRRFTIEQGELATPQGPSPYTIAYMRPFSCVLAVLDAGTPEARLVLVRQFRYAVNSWQLELPAGGIEEGEEPVQGALRELREESGLVVDEIRDLGWVYPSAGSTSERAYLYAARCSRSVGRELDQGEQMEVAYVDRNEMEELLAAGGDMFAHAVAYPCWMRFAAMGLLDAWMPTA